MPQYHPAPAAERTTAKDRHDRWLRQYRPDLAGRYRAELPAARAAVLARLWGAIGREPLPPGTRPAPGDPAAQPFAVAAAGLTVDGHDHPSALAAARWPDRPGFAAELDDSVATLALARAGQLGAGSPSTDRYVDAEQAVVDGHPLHPCCRTRTGMTTADVLAYGPEHRPSVGLPVIAVPPRRWHSTGDGLPPRLVMHPWQWEHLRDAHPYLVDTGGRVPARPLMSLRTFATPDGHVKTSLDVTMTGATRTVSPAAVHNGPVLSALLATLLRGTTIGPLAERAGGAVLVDGEPDRHLAMVVRDAPRLAPGERAVPVAALTDGRYALGQDTVTDPGAYLAAFAGLLLPPLFGLLDAGVALEAHGQNLILVTRRGAPRRLLYRDVGGVRVSPAALRRHGIDPPDLRGDVPDDDPDVLATKVLASAVATVLAGLVAHLSRRFGVDPAGLWHAVPAPAWLRQRADLPVKAMTAMRLAGTVDDIWARVPNPLAGR